MGCKGLALISCEPFDRHSWVAHQSWFCCCHGTKLENASGQSLMEIRSLRLFLRIPSGGYICRSSFSFAANYSLGLTQPPKGNIPRGLPSAWSPALHRTQFVLFTVISPQKTREAISLSSLAIDEPLVFLFFPIWVSELEWEHSTNYILLRNSCKWKERGG